MGCHSVNMGWPFPQVLIDHGGDNSCNLSKIPNSRRVFAFTPVLRYGEMAMHEMGIALEVYEQCREAVSGYGPGRLEKVWMAVGELSAVEPELIAFAWQAVTADTQDEESKLEIRWCPARQTCPDCGPVEARAEGSWLRLCPECFMPLVVEGGDELDIERIKYTTDDDKGES